MMHRQYSDQVFIKEAPVFIRLFAANKIYKSACNGLLVVARGYLEIATNHDKITELSAIADMLISRTNTHASNLKSAEIILVDLMEESNSSNNPEVLKLRGEIRKLLNQAM